MAEKYIKFTQNILGHDYAVGDIHGEFGKLYVALKAMGFDEAKDRLFSVGDLVDRGCCSGEALHWLNKPWFFAVKGNHEWFASLYVDGEMDYITYAMNGGAWLMELAENDQKVYATAFEQLPIAIEIVTSKGAVGIVHADCPFLRWEDFIAHIEEKTDPITEGDLCYQAIFSRDRYESGSEHFVEGIRALAVGHTTMGKPKVLGNVYYLDTGGWRAEQGKKFTFLELESLSLLSY